MNEHTPSDHEPHGRSFASTVHMIGAFGDFWSSDLNRAVVDLIDPKPGMTLLDLGAGFGAASVVAANRVRPGGRVVAVDPSTTMRAVQRVRRLWQRSRAVIDIRSGAAEVLPIATGSVDRAFAVNAAHHFDNVALAVSELARVLRPGGTILLVDEDFTNTHHPYHHRETGFEPDPVDAALIVGLLEDSGLSATHADHQPLAGITATVVRATASQQDRSSGLGGDRLNEGEPQ